MDGTVAFESLTPEQKESLRGVSITAVSIDIGGNLAITFSDGDSENVGNIIGPQGVPGPKVIKEMLDQLVRKVHEEKRANKEMTEHLLISLVQKNLRRTFL